MNDEIPLALRPHDFKALCKQADRARSLNRRGPVSIRRNCYYFTVRVEEGGEIIYKSVRLGAVSEITRHAAVEKADALFVDYRKNGVAPWSMRLNRQRDLSKIKSLPRREWYASKFEEQDGKCAICARETPHMCIDHCHRTGKLRALLCHSCNTALGKLQDDPAVIRRAADYVESFIHNSDTTPANGEQDAKQEIGQSLNSLL